MRCIQGKNKFYSLSKCQIVSFRSNQFPNSFNKSPFTAVGVNHGRYGNALRLHAALSCCVMLWPLCLFTTTIGLIERVSINLSAAVYRSWYNVGGPTVSIVPGRCDTSFKDKSLVRGFEMFVFICRQPCLHYNISSKQIIFQIEGLKNYLALFDNK